MDPPPLGRGKESGFVPGLLGSFTGGSQMLRRPRLALAVTLAAGLFVPTTRANAQLLGGAGGGIDPFSFYYGYYLPHQAAIAAQPTALDTINQVTAARQFSAVTDRAGLYDP